MYEHLSVEDAGVRQGQKLVLEPGTGPKEGEVLALVVCVLLLGHVCKREGGGHPCVRVNLASD